MGNTPDNSNNMGPSNDGRIGFRWSLAAAILLLLVMALPMLSGRIPTRDDLGAFHLPTRAFYSEQLARGEPFDWMPQLYCGFYLTGEGQAGTYHPWHRLLYGAFPLEAAWALELWTSYPFLLAGMYLLLRRKLGRRDAAMFGSLVFAFSGFMLLRFVHPNAVAVAAHIPWLLWAIDILLLDPSRPRVAAALAAVAALTGSQILLGYPQYVWFSLLAEAGYVVWLVSSGPEARHGSRLVRLAGAKVAGLMIGGVQLLPTVEALGLSVRQATDAAFVNSGSLHPLNLVQLIAPYLFAQRVAGQNTHELGFYVGAVPLVILVWMIATRVELGKLRQPVVAASTLAILSLLLAFGKYGPIYRFQQYVPLASGFRFPSRYLLLFTFAATVAAAIGFALLAGRTAVRPRWRRRETVAIWLPTVAATVAAAVGLGLGSRSFVAAPAAVLAGPALFGLASLLVFLTARGSRAALVALVLFVAADLGVYGLSYSVYPNAMRFGELKQIAVLPPGGAAGRVVLDPAGRSENALRTGNQSILAGVDRADGYAGLEPTRQLDYADLSALQTASVRWVRQTSATVTDPWQEVPDPMPRARLVGHAVTSRQPGRTLDQVPVATVAVVEQPLALGAGQPGVAAVLDDRPGRIEIRVDAPGPQLLVVSESYHPGWTVRVDDRAAKAWPVNGDFLGCPVQAGEHDVVFEFAPESLRRGKIVSLLGVILVAILVVGCRPFKATGRDAVLSIEEDTES